MQFFFINGRSIKSPLVTTALETAYKNSITVGKFPSAALFIEMPYDSVDVNVHPAKTEVRFQDEKRVFDCVYQGIRNAVITGEPVKSSFSAAGIFIKPDYIEKQYDLNSSQFTVKQYGTPSSEENVFRSPGPARSSDSLSGITHELHENTSSGSAAVPVSDEVPGKHEAVGDSFEVSSSGSLRDFSKDVSEYKNENKSVNEPFSENLSDLEILGEVYGVFVLVRYEGKLYISDKHAAHERIIFNSLRERPAASSQYMLQSITVKLSADEYAAVLNNLPLLSEAGYDITDFGDMTVSVKSCPVTLCSDDVDAILTETASYLACGLKEALPEKLDWIYHNTACRAAVKAGNHLSETELKELMVKVFSDRNVRYCPHGRPILLEITKKELEKLFMRTQ